ncbi:MAG: hypothetical protein Q4F07_09575 [Bacteroidales bacterium]|nr:hypothetical protein [Bacteroidales bacterium]
MRLSYALIVTSLLTAMTTGTMYADDSIAGGDDHSNKIEFKRTSPEVASILKHSRPVEAKSVPVPRFVVKSANNNFIMAIGGTITPILGYDIGNNLYKQDNAGISFVTSAIPVPAQKGKKGDFYINPINGSVDLQIVGLANTKNEITGYIKVGTNGISSDIVLQRAYVTWRNFTAGMKLTLMQDAYACQPPTIDPEGPSGCVSNVAYEIGYTSPSYKGFRYAVAIDMPTYYSSNGVYRGKDFPVYDGQQVTDYGDAEQLIPDVPAWVEYSFSQWNRIRFTGILRNFAYRDLVANKTRHMAGWGVMLSGNASPSNKLIFYYQLAYGHGIGNYLQDIAGKPISFVPKDGDPGRMSASPMMGANIGVTYNVNSRLQFNAMFSESRIWNVGEYCNALDESQNYKYALYGAVNCFYNITPYLQWGIEYLWGRRQTWNIGGANDSRIQTQIAFSF